MQCIALLNLAGSTGSEHSALYQVCRQIVTEMADQVTEISRQPESFSIQSMVSDEDTHEDRLQGPNGDEAVATSPVSSPGFPAVLGCEDAKAALFENIILPLRCDTSTYQTIFSGGGNCFSLVWLLKLSCTWVWYLVQAFGAERATCCYMVLQVRKYPLAFNIHHDIEVLLPRSAGTGKTLLAQVYRDATVQQFARHC
jgi:hypothetical protein